MEKPGKKKRSKGKKKDAPFIVKGAGVKLSVEDNEFLGSVLPPDYAFTPGISLLSYKPELDHALVAHMAKGYSFDSFAGVARVDMATLYSWERQFPSFAEAKRLGKAQARLWWERLSITHVAAELVRNPVTGKLQQPRFLNFPLWAFNMYNRFGWRAPTAEDRPRDEDDAAKSLEDRKIMSPDDWLAEVRKRRAEAQPQPEDVEALPVKAAPLLNGAKPEKAH